MPRLSASGPHRSSLWRRLRPRENAATLLRGAPACLALLAALAVLALAVPEQAEAQTDTTFISNSAQLGSRDSSALRATAFTTGSNSGGYALSSVDVYVNTPASGATPLVEIYENSSGEPGTLFATLSNPATVTNNSANTFTATNTTLHATTTYWLVTRNSASTTGTGFEVYTANNTTADTGAAMGWSIGNGRFKADISETSWTSSSNRIIFTIRGTLGAGTTTAQTETEVWSGTVTVSAISGTHGHGYLAAAHPITGTGGTLSSDDDFDIGSTTYTVWRITIDTSSQEYRPRFTVATGSTPAVADLPDKDELILRLTYDGEAGDFTLSDATYTDSSGTADSQGFVWSTGAGHPGATPTVGDTMTVALLRTSTNNAPTVVNAISDQAATVGTVFNYTVPDDTFTDADGDTLTYAAARNGGGGLLPSWLSFTAATRTFSGTPTAVQTVPVIVTASDGNGGSVSDYFDIVVSADTTTSVSGALVSNLNQSASGGAYPPGGTGSYFQSGGTDDLAQGFTTGMDAAGYTLTSIEIPFAQDISAADIGDLTVSIHADDGSGNPAATALFALDKPASIDGHPGSDDTDNAANLVAATYAFTVPAANTTTTFTMSTHYFVVLSYDQDVGIWYVEGDTQDSGAAPGWLITAPSLYKRGSGSWTDNPFSSPLLIRVNGTAGSGTVTNAAPTVANPIDDQTATVGAAFNYTVPANTFADTDAADTLTYTATQSDDSGLPSWLSFDAATRTFSGTPATANVGTLEVTVTASDGIDSVGDTFDIVVSADTTTATCTGMCLVSNLNQLATSETINFASGVARYAQAQGFTTGANPDNYTLTSIEVAFVSDLTAAAVADLTVSVWSDDGSGDPNAELFTLTKPVSIGAATAVGNDPATVTGNYTVFNAPAGRTLVARTTYHVVLVGDVNSYLFSTSQNDETSTTGWLIADAARVRQTAPNSGNWGPVSAASQSMLIRVNGTLGTTNTPPTVANPIDDQTATVGTALDYAFPTNTFNDADAADTLTYTATQSDDSALPSWLSFDDATRTFSGTPATADVGTLEVKVTARDGNGGSVSAEFDIVVSAATVVPTGQLFVDNTGEANAFAANVRTDDTTSQSFTTGPNTGGYILTSIGVVANLSASGDTFSLAVHTADTDGAPVALHANLIAPANFPAGETTVTFTAPPNTMLAADTPYAIVLGLVGAGRSLRTTRSDADNAGTSGWSIGNNHHFYSASAMAWRSSGNPRAAKIAIRGTTVGGGTNTAPTVANTIMDQTAMAGTAFNYEFPANTFNDADAGDTLTYTATLSDDSALPLWLSFDAATRTFSGTPQAADVETLSVKVKASDGTLSVSDTFDIVVSADTTTATCAGMCLVSNVAQTPFDYVGLNILDAAQSFTTGDNANGYTLTSIELRLDSSDSTDTPTVKLYSGSANGTEEATLTGPAMLDAATTKNYAFTPTSTVTLGMSTTYWVVAEANTGSVRWIDTHSLSEDATPAAHWAIADGRESRSASTTGSFSATAGNPLLIRVNGTPVANNPPTAANNTVTTAENTAYTFTDADFGYVDADGNPLASVKIVTLPSPGTLALDGTAVTVDAVVTKAQIDGNMLTFTPVAGATGASYASFDFKVNDGTDDSADAYTMTINVAVLPTITIAADRTTATGKVDWIRYTLSREGDPAAELTVTVTFVGPASNDWSLDPTNKAKRDVTFAANSATARQNIWLSGGFYGIGFSHSATTSGTLTARLGAKTGYDTSDTDEVAVVVTSGPAWVIKLADDHNRFDEDGGAQNIELVATAASAAIPAPSLDRFNKSVLVVVINTLAGTAEAYVDVDDPGDYQNITGNRYIPSSMCSADPDAGNALVCRSNVTFTPVDDAVAEPDETLELDLSSTSGGSKAIHFQGPGPDRTVHESRATYTITIVDNDISSDATLSALALANAADDSAIAISPVFASGTTSYTATVDNGVDEITIEATVNEGSATFEYLDSSDTAITDADGAKTGQQVSLAEGATTIKVKVTAEDTTTTNTYTVVVTRAAATNTPPTAANNTVTTAEDTAYTFTEADFRYVDAESDPLASVKIVTVPTPGTLALDGTAVLADAVVTKADIDDGKLIFTPVAGASGDPYATFTFKVNDGTDDSVDAYTMTIDVTSSDPAITIVADRATATGKVDWIHYTLSRGGDPAAELTVTVTVAGPADNDWSLNTAKTSQEVTFGAGNATVKKSILLGGGFFGIGFSNSAITSGTLTARLGAKTGYDTSDTDAVQVVVTSDPPWVIKLADDAYRFTEDGGGQDIEAVATAASVDIPVPSLDSSDNSVLKFTFVTEVTATDAAPALAPEDFTFLSTIHYFTSSRCSADPDAGNVLVCRTNVTFTPADDAEAEPDETLELVVQPTISGSTALHFQGPGPDRTVSSTTKLSWSARWQPPRSMKVG